MIEDRTLTNDVLILDMPVPHKGYLDLLRKHADGSINTLYLIGKDVFDSLQVPREIRANDPETTKKMLNGLGLPFEIKILGLNEITNLSSQGIYTAKDLISQKLHEKYFPDAPVTEENVFLRWDASNVTIDRPVLVEEETHDQFHVQMMKRANELADTSSDWWRRVGVVVVRDRQILIEGYNQAFPTDHKPYIDGNPRDHTQPGTLGFLVSTVHAEQGAIAKAAGQGIKLEGSDLYLNSFPCPPCATSMGLAGIRRCFVSGGNAYLDAAEVLKAIGIKTIFVKNSEG